MSRVSLINQLYSEKKSALEFNFDRLSIPPMNLFLSVLDIQRLHQIASSVRYAGNIDKKYELIDKVMKRRNFRKLAAGTNRVVYYHLEDPRFVAKIAIDRVGMSDNPKEFKNQEYIKPFCTKVFEVDPTGVVALVERVNPIMSIEEFISIADDVFNLITEKIIGKYVLDDIGATRWMNYGCRMGGFGPVILDFPYVYELDGNKLRCQHEIDTIYGKQKCGGEIDYDDSFDNLVCSKCGKVYKARDLENKNKEIKLEMNSEGSASVMTRARIIKNGKVYKDSNPSSSTYVSKDQFNQMVNDIDLTQDVIVDKTIHLRSQKKENRDRVHTELMMKYYSNSDATSATIIGIDKIKKNPEYQMRPKKNKFNNRKKEVHSSQYKDHVPKAKIVCNLKTTEEQTPEVKEEPKEEIVIRAEDTVKVTDAVTTNESVETSEESAVTEQAIEMLMKGMYNNIIKEDEPKVFDAVDTPHTPEVEEEEDEIPFSEYREVYSERQKIKKHNKFSDDMLDY